MPKAKCATLLPEGTQYIGVDYYDTAIRLYGTRPDLFGDAHALPLADATADNVLMLHVLEHLANPQQALKESARILRTGGRLLIEVPFAYPLHDSPLDFHRWTAYGLAADLRSAGLETLDVRSIGRPTETAALLFNLSIARLCLDWVGSRSPWLIMAPLILLLIPVVNLMGWTLARLGGSQDFLPHRVRAWCRKPP